MAQNRLGARRAAHYALQRVLIDGSYADRVLHGGMKGLDERERRQAKRLVFGCVQRCGTFDYLIDRYVDRELDPQIRAAIWIGMYELLYSDSVPARAAVSSAVELVKPHSGYNLVNAVLRKISDNPVELPSDDTVEGASVAHSYPRWLVEMWWKQLGPEAAVAVLKAGNQPAEISIRANTLRFPDRAPGVNTDPTLPDSRVIEGPIEPLKDPEWLAGNYVVMSRSSMRVAPALNPQPGERVLDMCAAPGGKTTHLAALMGAEGQIDALELHKARAEALVKTCKRTGAKNVNVILADALNADLKPGSYDRVLLDGPCSGLGTLASRPDLRWRMTPERIQGLVDVQTRLLQVAERAVKPGGTITYSVCTINPDEEQLQSGKVTRVTPDQGNSDGFYIATMESA